MILHGFVRSTKDVDILIDTSADNIQAVKRAMSTLPDNAADLVADDDVERYQVVRVADEIVVDLMGAACGIAYADAVGLGIDRIRIEDVEIPVANKDLLIRTKQTYRESDALDVRFLRLRLEEEKKRR